MRFERTKRATFRLGCCPRTAIPEPRPPRFLGIRIHPRWGVGDRPRTRLGDRRTAMGTGGSTLADHATTVGARVCAAQTGRRRRRAALWCEAELIGPLTTVPIALTKGVGQIRVPSRRARRLWRWLRNPPYLRHCTTMAESTQTEPLLRCGSMRQRTREYAEYLRRGRGGRVALESSPRSIGHRVNAQILLFPMRMRQPHA